jgi:very-short-patch-repair endonuclease
MRSSVCGEPFAPSADARHRGGVDHEERVRQAIGAAHEAAIASGGTVCRGSAALSHGWELLKLPARPQVTVPKGRRQERLDPRLVEYRRLNLREDQVADLVTVPWRTLADCLRYYPASEGLCVAESALRHGFPRYRLDELAHEARGPNAFKIKLVARAADSRTANVFESATRAIALSVSGLQVVPQVSIYEDGVFLGRPDLVDEQLGLIVEADSAKEHATVEGINRDAARYDTFVVHGWIVLRFTWRQVVHQPTWVRTVLVAAVERRRTELGLPLLTQPRTLWVPRARRVA